LDRYKNISTTLDPLTNNSYIFQINAADTLSQGYNRFQLVFDRSALSVNGTVDVRHAIKVFPNPFGQHIQLVLADNATFYGVQMSNAMGIVVYKVRLSPGNHLVDVSKLPQGLYFLKVIASDGETHSRKLIKQ
jgi:hypothetical protein